MSHIDTRSTSRCTRSHIYLYKTSIKYTNTFSIEIQETVTGRLVIKQKIRIHVLYTWYDKCKWAATWQNQQNGCAPSEDSDQSGHPPSLNRVFAVRMKKAWVLSYPLSAQRRLWSYWADAQVGLSLRWAHTHFDGFVMLWLKLSCLYILKDKEALKMTYRPLWE